MPLYRLRDSSANDLGLLRHPVPNLEPGDEILLCDGRAAIVTARIESAPNRALTALLEVLIPSEAWEALDPEPR